MKPLHIITIVLDGMPFMPMQLATFNRLSCDWVWHIVEGVADNVQCTSWCAKIPARLSRDGTTEFLHRLRGHPRVRIYQRAVWPGKVEMFNTAVATIEEDCVLMEIDADEIWQPYQLERIVEMFEHRPEIGHAMFQCRYFVGLNLITVGDDCYGNNPGEWKRAWNFRPGMRFLKHEPPVMENEGIGENRYATKGYDLVFDHYAYAFPHQLKFKEEYYQYKDAYAYWRVLQTLEPRKFPMPLNRFLPWVDDRVLVDTLHKAE